MPNTSQPIELPADLAHALKTLRLRTKLTRTELARRAGVRLPTWCRWEDGEAPPRSPAIRARVRAILDGNEGPIAHVASKLTGLDIVVERVRNELEAAPLDDAGAIELLTDMRARFSGSQGLRILTEQWSGAMAALGSDAVAKFARAFAGSPLEGTPERVLRKVEKAWVGPASMLMLAALAVALDDEIVALNERARPNPPPPPTTPDRPARPAKARRGRR